MSARVLKRSFGAVVPAGGTSQDRHQGPSWACFPPSCETTFSMLEIARRRRQQSCCQTTRAGAVCRRTARNTPDARLPETSVASYPYTSIGRVPLSFPIAGNAAFPMRGMLLGRAKTPRQNRKVSSPTSTSFPSDCAIAVRESRRSSSRADASVATRYARRPRSGPGSGRQPGPQSRVRRGSCFTSIPWPRAVSRARACSLADRFFQSGPQVFAPALDVLVDSGQHFQVNVPHERGNGL